MPPSTRRAPSSASPPAATPAWRTLPAFAILGITAGLLGVVITRGLFTVESLYRRLPVSEFWHPVIGAAAFACVGLIEPRALGVGYDAIDDVLNSRLALGTVAVLGAVELVAWWLALGSGTSGGTLAPILLMAGVAGTLVGAGLVDQLIPGAPTSRWAPLPSVAMAATFRRLGPRATFSPPSCSSSNSLATIRSSCH